MTKPVYSEDIKSSKQFAEEIVATTLHNESQVAKLARCYLATLDDLESLELERTDPNLTTHG